MDSYRFHVSRSYGGPSSFRLFSFQSWSTSLKVLDQSDNRFFFFKDEYGIILAKFVAKYSSHRFVIFNKRFNSVSEMPNKVHDGDFENGAIHSI